MKEKINLTESFIKTLRKNFVREHHKFVTESTCTIDMIDKCFEYDNGDGPEEFKVVGLFDIKEYVIESTKTGRHFINDYQFITEQFKRSGQTFISSARINNNTNRV